ncbi:hypothetical protein AB0K74_46790 [Streptomyces sp. NPDC056159]|uniref:hypothetical protein n=1 Tax=Streptomyces sp. NPDC056159 TaxID=3155537 RepID=UPI0034248652
MTPGFARDRHLPQPVRPRTHLAEGSYRLATSLTDSRRYPAASLTRLYHQRWEHESAYFALRHTIMAGRVLRSGDPVGVEQEMWALLTLYQALRTVMVDAAESVPGTDPDRCGFTIAFQAARDQVVQAAGVGTANYAADGRIGQKLLAGLLPARRQRVSTRKVKSPMSRYSERHDAGRPDVTLSVTSLDISIHEPPETQPALPTRSRDDRYVLPTRRRRHRILALLQENPTRLWRPREIAAHFGDITLHAGQRPGLPLPEDLPESDRRGTSSGARGMQRVQAQPFQQRRQRGP